ncbi:ABC transporter substrate-binding protein [Alkalihalophilus sp. As8PL]|uniref:ABC transporter substrate-binding protein n=1 Tax=Alkalihalophilus sp. As8PL TaxID=3237103 RepID=A0AB39BUY3_9BACI
MRKKWSVMLFVLIFSLFVTACGGGNQETTSEGNSDEEASTGDKIVLDFWQIDSGDKEAVYQDAVERFEEKNPGVEVNMLRIPNDDYKQRMVVAMSGGNPPDVFTSWGGGWLKEFADAGQVLDLTNEDIEFENFLEMALNNTTFDEKVYGLPLGLSQTLFFYNKEIFETHGLEEPETYDELLAIIDELNENDVIPITLTNQTKWPGAYYLMYFADRLGSEELFQSAFNRDGRGFDDPTYVKAGEYIQELVDRNAFNPGFNGVPYDAGQGRQLLYSGQSAMMLMTNTLVVNMRSEAPEFEEKLGMFPFPTLPDGKGDPSNVGGATSPVWSAYSGTEHPELAIELMKELTTLETAEDYVNRTGSLSALIDVPTDDVFVQQFAEMAAEANDIHMPYDQTLPPVLAELHKDTTQELFGKTMTPQEAADLMEQKAKETLD